MYVDVQKLEDDVLSYSLRFQGLINGDRNIINQLNSALNVVKRGNISSSEPMDVFSDEFQLMYELNNALLMSTYGRYEAIFNDFCNMLRISLGINLDIENLRFSGFKRVIVYLESLNLVSRKEITSYRKVDCWRVVRNTLVHSNGIPDERDSKQIGTTGVLWAGETCKLHAKEIDCLNLLTDIESLFDDLVNNILDCIEDARL